MPMTTDLDLDLLRAFVAVAEAQSFTRAARRLGRVQSAVSMQIKRLEDTAGRRLFARSHRGVALTDEGEILLGYARRMLLLNEEALADLGQAAIEGAVRLGVADTAAGFLPGILSRFAQAHPRVQLEVRCDRSWHLLDAVAEGGLDLALVTQTDGRERGRVVRREPLVWAASSAHRAFEERPLPLALFAPGCAYRKAAIRALDASEWPWRIAYSSTSLDGVRAAVRAGIAVAALARSTVEKGMRILGSDAGFPPLPSYEITLHQGAGDSAPCVERLAEAIIDDLALPAGAATGPMRAVPLSA